MMCSEKKRLSVGDVEVALDEGDDGIADDRDGAKERDDDVGAPVGGLSPRQQVAHEGFRHQCKEDERAEKPDELARFAEGAVHQAAEHVHVNADEEEGGAGGMHVADEPAKINVAHDVFDAAEGFGGARFVEHRQPDAGEDLVHQDDQRQRAEQVPEVEVFRRVVAVHVVVPQQGQREAVINPAEQTGGFVRVTSHFVLLRCWHRRRRGCRF